MKCLQDLVPGCTKVTGKAGRLDEIINYVQSLQRQIEVLFSFLSYNSSYCYYAGYSILMNYLCQFIKQFLSMKLAALNPRLDFDVDSFFTKEVGSEFKNIQNCLNLRVIG